MLDSCLQLIAMASKTFAIVLLTLAQQAGEPNDPWVEWANKVERRLRASEERSRTGEERLIKGEERLSKGEGTIRLHEKSLEILLDRADKIRTKQDEITKAIEEVRAKQNEPPPRGIGAWAETIANYVAVLISAIVASLVARLQRRVDDKLYEPKIMKEPAE
jgi:hypothetical protein